jgi:hypothetical protein
MQADATLEARKKNRDAGAKKAKEFTAEQILAARARAGRKQSAIAAELRCDVKTLRNNLTRLKLGLS